MTTFIKQLFSSAIIVASFFGYAQASNAPGSIVTNMVGCNTVSVAQVPGSPEYFLNRQLIGSTGKISGPNDCSGGNPANTAHGLPYNHWALTLTYFDWATHTFSLLKTVLDTSIDPRTGLSRAIITGGSQKGEIIRSAYDPSLVKYEGVIYVAYECTLETGITHGVQGTSSCVSVYDPIRQIVDLSHTWVMVSGQQVNATRFVAAAVPQLMVSQNRLFIYWSTLTIDNGTFTGITIRGTELIVNSGAVSVKTSPLSVVHVLDQPATVQVWSPNMNDSTANETVDLRGVWVAGSTIVAAASLGGKGCADPTGTSPGCFRFSASKATQPLVTNGFNSGASVINTTLPTNAQEYTRAVVDPQGNWWFIGHYIKPVVNGLSNLRPMPSATFWATSGAPSVLAMYPITDRSLWPTNE